MTDESKGVREAARDVLKSRLTEKQIEELFDGALAITKQGWGSCPYCKKRVTVEIQDAKSVVSAIAEITTKIADLPTVRDEGERITFQRLVEMPKEVA